ncbi:MAG: family 20 glycosylhydrolase [Clostridia bacterium]|nr:family 20 glycosylhydrolase [Clostridia bacterium]
MISLLPTPKKCTLENEQYHPIAPTIYTEVPAWNDAVAAFCESVGKIYEIEMTVKESAGVLLKKDNTLAPNAYVLDSTGEEIVIRAATDEGAHYGLATALQLISCKDGTLAVQGVLMEDYPEKEYRSFMIATGRIFHPFKKMLKYVDLCYFYKVKYLHMHVADSFLYSIPSKAFPKLMKQGKYYTYQEIEELNRYAAARGITLIPEVECPGHTTLLAEAYPEVFADHADEARQTVCDPTAFEHGQAGVICAGSERSFEGIKTLFAEVAELFPNAPYIHIGGDEAPYETWEHCVDCRAYMKKHGLKNAYELYSEYVGRVASHVLSLGRTPIVWEGFPAEGAHYIPKETIVIAWESRYQLAPELLQNGFKIVNASWKPLYIVTPTCYDHYTYEDILNWNVYNWQNWHPKCAATLNPINVQPTADVLGGTLAAWSMQHEQLISRLLENMPAFSERTWTVLRQMDLDTYKRIFGCVSEKAAKLIADIC